MYTFECRIIFPHKMLRARLERNCLHDSPQVNTPEPLRRTQTPRRIRAPRKKEIRSRIWLNYPHYRRSGGADDDNFLRIYIFTTSDFAVIIVATRKKFDGQLRNKADFPRVFPEIRAFFGLHKFAVTSPLNILFVFTRPNFSSPFLLRKPALFPFITFCPRLIRTRGEGGPDKSSERKLECFSRAERQGERGILL